MRPISAHSAAAILLASSLLALVACGGHEQPASTPIPQSSFVLPQPPEGPYDINHHDQAVAAATAAAHKVLGTVALSDPSARFVALPPVPQAPGREVALPVYGWNVTFQAKYHTEVSAGSAPQRIALMTPGFMVATPPPPATTYQAPAQGKLASSSAVVASLPQVLSRTSPNAPQIGRPPPPALRALPGLISHLELPTIPDDMNRSLHPSALNASHGSLSDSKLGENTPTHRTTIAIFVAVDGSTRVL